VITVTRTRKCWISECASAGFAVAVPLRPRHRPA
jgi:hypothetical protein